MACSLLKHVLGKIDTQAKEYALHYLRTKEQQEVDFALVCEGKIEKMIQVKNRDETISTHLRYFQEKYDFSGIQVV